MGAAPEIRTDLASPAWLRRLARRERNPRAASRMPAIAGAPEGMGRAGPRRRGRRAWSGGRRGTRWSAATARGRTACATGPRRAGPGPGAGRGRAGVAPERGLPRPRPRRGRRLRPDPADAVPLVRGPPRQAAAPGQPLAGPAPPGAVAAEDATAAPAGRREGRGSLCERGLRDA